MAFIVELLVTSNKYDSIWFIMDKLNKYAHLIPTKSRCFIDTLIQICTKEIITLNGVQFSIELYKGPQFT